jgi:Ni,Fe-hydrogenase III large subunit
MVRWLEAQQSIDFIAAELDRLPTGSCRAPVAQPRPEMLAVALTEGWRGEICHTAITGQNGELAAYKLVDPSFHNWTGLALALRGEQISDFPLCNKSFNLSYCGFDL